MAETKKKLTGKQELFCREYIIDHNAVQAAIRAGYSKKTAHGTGPENLRKPSILERIKQLQEPKLKKLELTADMVKAELKLLAFSDIGSFFDEDGYLKEWKDLKREQTACLSAVDMQMFRKPKEGEERLHISQACKMKLWSKIDSLKMLASHFALLNNDPLGGDEGDIDESFL